MGFAAPQASGDLLGPNEVLGHLLICIPTDVRVGIETIHGVNDAVVVDVAVLTQKDQNGQVPVYRDVLWFNISLRNTLKRQVGQCVLARMGQGEAKRGQNPPNILVDATKDSQAVAFAESWMDQHPEFEREAMAKVQGGNGFAAPAPTPQPSVPVPASIPNIPQQAPVIPTQQQPVIPAVPQQVPVIPTQQQPATAQPAGGIDFAALAGLSPEEQQKLLQMALGQQQGN